MQVARLYLILSLVILTLAVPVESRGQNLAKLREVNILVEEMSSESKELGLTREDLKNHAFVLLRNKLPRLVINESATEHIYIRVHLAYSGLEGRRKVGYFGVTEVKVFRVVAIAKTKKFTAASVWDNYNLLTGSLDRPTAFVRESLDRLLTKFAADWIRDNP